MASETVKEKPLGKQVEQGLKESKGQPFELSGVRIMQRGSTVIIESVEPITITPPVETQTNGSELP